MPITLGPAYDQSHIRQPGVLPHDDFDLTDLHTDTTDLDLLVGPPEERDVPRVQ